MKKEIVITPRASEDLLTIWLYGCWNFGETQADRYALKINKLFSSLQVINLGRRRTDYGRDFYSIIHSEHIVIYRVVPEQVVITRILHHSQDYPSHITWDTSF